MKTLDSSYRNHLWQSVTTLAVCCRIVKKNGEIVRGTTHDRDIPITRTNIGGDLGLSPPLDLTGTYLSGAGITGSDIRSSSDMSVDNLEVEGAILEPVLWIPDLTVADIEAGLYDSALVTTFCVNWQEPDVFQEVLRHGWLGDSERTAEGRYMTEIRGLTQALQQQIGQTCGERCNVKRFGDSRCKFNVAAVTATGTVTAVTSSRRFDTTLVQGSPPVDSPNFRLGELTWVTGANAGYKGQVKLDNVDDVLGNLEMFEEFPEDVEVGDTFTLTPGCDRRYETCRDVWDNLINFRGPGIFIPGPDEIMRAP